MRPEELYLSDIVEAVEAIERFLEGIDRDAFLGDELRRSAVLQKLIVSGVSQHRCTRVFRGELAHSVGGGHPGCAEPASSGRQDSG